MILLADGQLSSGMKEEILHLSAVVRCNSYSHFTVHLDLGDNLLWKMIERFEKIFPIDKDVFFLVYIHRPSLDLTSTHHETPCRPQHPNCPIPRLRHLDNQE
jgi:hypothetical protein